MVPRAVCACISGLFCLIPTSFCLCPQLFFFFFSFFWFVSSYFQIFMKDGGRKEVCFQYLMLDLWPLLSQSLILTRTPSLGLFSPPASSRSSAVGAHWGDSFISVAPFGACSHINLNFFTCVGFNDLCLWDSSACPSFAS